MASTWTQHFDAEIPLRVFKDDFQEMIYDVEGWKKLGHRDSALVEVRPYDDFIAWAEAQEPDWNRYAADGTEALVEQGRLPRSALKDELDPDLKRAGVSRDEWLRLGFDRYVGAIAESIAKGHNVAPLLAANGKPVDGRHRALAAKRLGLAEAPVIDLRPINNKKKSATQLDAEIAEALRQNR